MKNEKRAGILSFNDDIVGTGKSSGWAHEFADCAPAASISLQKRDNSVLNYYGAAFAYLDAQPAVVTLILIDFRHLQHDFVTHI